MAQELNIQKTRPSWLRHLLSTILARLVRKDIRIGANQFLID